MSQRTTFSLSQMNDVELAQTLSWREIALFGEWEKNVFVKPNEQRRACSNIVMARIGNRRHGALGEVERQNALFGEWEKNVPSHNNLRLYLIGRSSNVQYLGFCTAATNRWWGDNNKCPISFLYTF